MNKLFSIALMGLVFASCQNTDSSETATTDSTSTTTFSSPATATVDTNTHGISSTPTTSATPAITVTPASTAAPTAKTATKAANAAGLNPAHGEPGHRCDIAVGAPLNSPPGNTPAAGITTTPAPATTQAPAAVQPAGSGAKLNPAHGEPGHDCKVAVGAPLKN